MPALATSTLPRSVAGWIVTAGAGIVRVDARTVISYLGMGVPGERAAHVTRLQDRVDPTIRRLMDRHRPSGHGARPPAPCAVRASRAPRRDAHPRASATQVASPHARAARPLGTRLAPGRPRGDAHGRRFIGDRLALNAAVGVLSVGCPTRASSRALTFAEPTLVYDRTGTVELGRFEREERRVVASATSRSSSSTRRPPPRTGRSGPTAGSTPRRSSRPRPRAPGRRRARRLDDHPAARPGAAAAARRHRARRRPLRAQGQGAHPVGRA